MAWCHQATNHFLNLCWPRSVFLYGVTGPQLFDLDKTVFDFVLCDCNPDAIIILAKSHGIPGRTWKIFFFLTNSCLIFKSPENPLPKLENIVISLWYESFVPCRPQYRSTADPERHPGEGWWAPATKSGRWPHGGSRSDCSVDCQGPGRACV